MGEGDVHGRTGLGRGRGEKRPGLVRAVDHRDEGDTRQPADAHEPLLRHHRVGQHAGDAHPEVPGVGPHDADGPDRSTEGHAQHGVVCVRLQVIEGGIERLASGPPAADAGREVDLDADQVDPAGHEPDRVDEPRRDAGEVLVVGHEEPGLNLAGHGRPAELEDERVLRVELLERQDPRDVVVGPHGDEPDIHVRRGVANGEGLISGDHQRRQGGAGGGDGSEHSLEASSHVCLLLCEVGLAGPITDLRRCAACGGCRPPWRCGRSCAGHPADLWGQASARRARRSTAGSRT